MPVFVGELSLLAGFENDGQVGAVVLERFACRVVLLLRHGAQADCAPDAEAGAAAAEIAGAAFFCERGLGLA